MSNSQAQRFGTLSPLTHLLLKVPMVNRSVVARSLKTPHGRLRPEEEKGPRAQGHEVMVQGRRQVRALQYGSGPQILLVHGWGGAGVQMAAFVDPLVERGYSVVVVDLPAHGGSEGRTTEIREAKEALLAVERYFGPFEAAIAHSWGAAVLAYAQQQGLAIAEAVMIAPLPSLEAGMSEFSQRTGVSLRLLDDAFGELEKRLSVHRDEMNLHLVGKKLRTPLLLIHDHEDYRTSIDHSRALEQSWPGARLVETYGLGHRRILRDYHVIQQAVAFVSQAKLSRKSDLEGQLNSPLC